MTIMPDRKPSSKPTPIKEVILHDIRPKPTDENITTPGQPRDTIPHDIIIRSSDGIQHPTNQAHLRKISGFFENLFSLPNADEDAQTESLETVPEPLIVDLTSATPRALAAILKTSHTCIFPTLSPHDDTWEFCVEMIRAIDAYEFRGLYLCQAIFDCFENKPYISPFRQFVLAATLHLNLRTSTAISTCVLPYSIQISERDRRLVENINPKKYDFLFKELGRKWSAWKALKEIFLHGKDNGEIIMVKYGRDKEVPLLQAGFGRCKHGENSCPGLKWYGSRYSSYAKIIGICIWEDMKFRTSGYVWDLYILTETITAHTGCRDCGNRIGGYYWRHMRKYLGQLRP